MGGSSNTQVTQTLAEPGLTPEERLLVQKEIDLADFQLRELEKQSQLQSILFGSPEEFRLSQEQEVAFQAQQRELQRTRDELSLTNLEAAQELLPLQTAIARKQLEAFEKGNEVDDETKARIDELTAQQQEIGISDIDARTDRLIEQVIQEVAPGTGLRPTDTPIVQRLDKVGEAAAEQKGQFIRGLQSGAAQAKLNFPIAQGQLTAARGQFLSNLGGLAGQFQSELQQQASLNRFQSTGQAGQLGLGLTAGNTQPGQLGVGLQSARIQQGGSNTTFSRSGLTGNEIASIAGGTGSLLTGISGIISG